MVGFGFQVRVFAALFLLSAVGAAAESMSYGEAERRFQSDNTVFSGRFNGADRWSGRLCDGYYSYDVDLSTVLSTVDFELNDNNTISVYADLRDVQARAGGVYRSQATLCFPLRGWTDLAIERAEIFSEVLFQGEGDNLSDMRLRIVATKLGRVRLGKHAPGWLERFLTHLANKALARIWASRLGEWISDRIGDIIKKKIPVHFQSDPMAGVWIR